LTRDVNESIPENVRVLRDEDMDRLRGVQSLEELNDVYSHFILYYGNDVPAMQEAHRLKEREMAKERRQAAARRKQAEDGGEPMDVDDADVDLLDLEDVQIDEESTVKQARRSDLYSLCAKVVVFILFFTQSITYVKFILILFVRLGWMGSCESTALVPNSLLRTYGTTTNVTRLSSIRQNL